MGKIFAYEDHEGDSVRFESRIPADGSPDWVALRIPEDVSNGIGGRGVDLPRSEVLSLIQALTEWAYPAHTPEGPNRSLIEELIVKAVKDQVAAVLPLHLSPQRTATGGGVAWAPEPDDEDGWQRSVAEHRPQECPGAGQCPEADPEPGDVGHPRPPLPVRGKTSPVCVCVLCKQPWSDSHGTVGDPCPTLQATDNVEDWHEALWRVRPSAPASDARYCGECGHLWEWHDPECGATRGKGRCECTRRPE